MVEVSCRGVDAVFVSCKTVCYLFLMPANAHTARVTLCCPTSPPPPLRRLRSFFFFALPFVLTPFCLVFFSCPFVAWLEKAPGGPFGFFGCGHQNLFSATVSFFFASTFCGRGLARRMEGYASTKIKKKERGRTAGGRMAGALGPTRKSAHPMRKKGSPARRTTKGKEKTTAGKRGQGKPHAPAR